MTEQTLQSVSITLPTGEAPLRVTVQVPAWPVAPQVMLPLFHQLANTVADLAEHKAEAQAQRISCRKGCAACCRQPVPLAEAEIHYLVNIVAQQPEPRRSELLRRFHTAASHFQETGWLEAYARCTDAQELKGIVREYFNQRVACPFLEEESCSIHPQRPVACREYLVTSDPLHCAADTDAEVRRLPMATTMMDMLGKMVRFRQLPGGKSFLPMVFALAWAEQFPEPAPEKTGVEWLAEACR